MQSLRKKITFSLVMSFQGKERRRDDRTEEGVEVGSWGGREREGGRDGEKASVRWRGRRRDRSFSKKCLHMCREKPLHRICSKDIGKNLPDLTNLLKFNVCR